MSLPPAARTRLRWEIGLVLALGLGRSAVYAVVELIDRLTVDTPLGEQVTTLHPARSDRAGFDLVYQLLSIGFSLVPAALACFLLWQNRRPHLGRLGWDATQPGRDTARGLLLALAIGLPGLALYLLGRAAGQFVLVDPGGLDSHPWTIPVLLLSAARASVQEEVVLLGYLFFRLRQLGWSASAVIVLTAVLRASYHLYQGPGAFLGNLAMGLVFAALFARNGRLLPFLVAHFAIDAAVFVGYPWAAGAFPGLLTG